MKTKQEIIDGIIDVEGGFVDDSSDSGGSTNFGITKAVARAYGYGGCMRDLPRSLAFEIYLEKYWHSVRADELLDMAPGVCAEVVDTAINMGPATAGIFLQRVLKVLGKEEVKVDGLVGKQTIYALSQYLSWRDEQTLLTGLNALQGAKYIRLAENRPKDRKFVYGWLKNRVTM